MACIAELAAQIVEGNASATERLTRQLLDEGLTAAELLERGLIAGMGEVGIRFRNHQMYVPDVLASARAMNTGMAILEPLLAAAGVAGRGRVLLSTVKGDIHEIGKNLVGIMLRGAGLEVIDLGVNVTAAKLVAAVREHRPQIVGLSALLTTTMTQMPLCVAALREAGLLGDCRVIVGGAPVTEAFAKSAGAHGYCKDAMTTVPVVLALLHQLAERKPLEVTA